MSPESNNDCAGVVLRVGRSVLDAEHGEFVRAGIDNLEHVPRVLRLARAVAAAAGSDGATVIQQRALLEELVEYGRQLFLAEWNAEIMEGEDAESVNAEGLREFDRLCDDARSEAEDV